MNKTVKVLDNSGSPSETDLQLISGIMFSRGNPRLVMVTNGGTELDWQKLMLVITKTY